MKINNNIVDNQLGEETVLLNLDSGQYYVLNDVASVAWNGIKNNKNTAAICEDICQQFENDPNTVETDVKALLQDFLDRKLLAG